jgi:O-antigen/teichoic acid export membrane protein
MFSVKSIALNTLAQYFSRFGTIMISLVGTSILTRSLGSDGYGRFGLITTLAIFFVTLADWGTHATAVREASRENDPSSVFSNSWGLRAILAILTTLLYLILVNFYPGFDSFRKEAMLASPLIIILSLRTSGLIIHQTFSRLYIPAAAELLGSLAYLLVLLFLWKTSQISLISVLAGVVVGSLINMALTVLSLNHPLNISYISRPKINSLLMQAVAMGGYLFLFSMYNRVDTYILQYFHGDGATGVYLLSYKIHENVVLLAAYLMNSLYPLISKSTDAAKEIYNKFFLIFIISAGLVILLGQIFSPFLVGVLGGNEFRDSVPVLRILIVATGISFLNHLLGYTLIAVREQNLAFKFAALSLIVNVSLNIILIPHYSFYAAAFVTILTELLMLCLSFYFLTTRYNFKFSFNPKLLLTQIKWMK